VCVCVCEGICSLGEDKEWTIKYLRLGYINSYEAHVYA
jgi:hypothetical protein